MHRRAALACRSPRDTQSILGLVLRRSNHASFPQDQPASSSTRNRRLALSRKAYNKMKKSTLKVIKRAMVEAPGWKDTPTLRGKEQKLMALVKANSSKSYKSFEQEVFEDAESEESEEPDEYETSTIVPIGSFVETRRSLIVSHGVVVGIKNVARRRRMIVLMTTGDIWYPGQHDIPFAIPNFLPMDLVERCSSDETVVSSVQLNARIEILRRLREIESKSEVMHNTMSMKCSNVYRQVKSPDPNAWNTTNLREISRLISIQPDTMSLFGLHKYIMGNPIYFVADQTYETNQIIHVRPQAHVDNIRTIKDWTRIPDGPIQSFAAKARRLISENQQIQYMSRAEAPSYGPATHVWTKIDRTILKFLHNSLRQARANQSDPYSLGVSYILKQINPEQPANDSDIHETLIGVGGLAPWQDPVSNDPALGVDTEPEPTSSWIKQQEAVATRGFASLASSGTETPLGPEDFHRTDPLESVRHDFGDLPVYVIDDAGAHELDDGISIESIPSEPDHVWVHAHVADPASLIPRTHALAKEAFTRGSTVYFKHRTWPLFPDSLMTHPNFGLSLGRDTSESPLRVITFSGKLDNMGQLLDYKVRAGLINNVKVITYEQVNELLGQCRNVAWYPFGRQLQSVPKPANLTDSDVKDLRDLQTVAYSLSAKRYRAGIVLTARHQASLEPIARPPPEIFGPVSEPKTFRGFPTFEYSVMKASDIDSGARALVAEAMKLASCVASRFCTEHNLPVTRLFAGPPTFSPSADMQEILDMRAPNCYIPGHFLVDKLEAPPMSGRSLEPKAHIPLGVAEGEGYTRVTSPLRRYGDLVVHWQIHHALLGSKASRPSPPFDAEEIWEITKATDAIEKKINIFERVHNRFWQSNFINRWAQEHGGFGPSNELLSNLKVYTRSDVVMNPRTGVLQVQVDCPHLGLQGVLDQLTSYSTIPAGGEVDVRMREIALGIRPQFYFSPKN